MNLSPVLGGSALVQDSMQNVGVDDIWPGYHDMVAGFRNRRCDKASSICVVSPEDSLRVLGNDLDDEVRRWVVAARLQ
jgi:hypothetical protein